MLHTLCSKAFYCAVLTIYWGALVVGIKSRSLWSNLHHPLILHLQKHIMSKSAPLRLPNPAPNAMQHSSRGRNSTGGLGRVLVLLSPPPHYHHWFTGIILISNAMQMVVKMSRHIFLDEPMWNMWFKQPLVIFTARQWHLVFFRCLFPH